MKIEYFTKIGKAILIEGSKAVTLGAGVTVALTLIKGGTAGVKELNIDKLLKKEKD